MIILYTAPRHREAFDGISSSGTRIPCPESKSDARYNRAAETVSAALHSNFESRTDNTMDLLDAVCRPTGAKPMVELSLDPFFPRNYGCIHDNIQQFPAGTEQLLKRMAPKNSR